MSDDRMICALERLEQAVLRAEGAAAALAQHAARDAARRESLQGDLERLESRHRRLRASAASAIERLDALVTPATQAPADG